MPRTTTFAKLPVGARFKFWDSGICTFYKVREGYYALGKNGHGGTVWEPASTLVVPLDRPARAKKGA